LKSLLCFYFAFVVQNGDMVLRTIYAHA
jgi:hypothetical protein